MTLVAVIELSSNIECHFLSVLIYIPRTDTERRRLGSRLLKFEIEAENVAGAWKLLETTIRHASRFLFSVI